MVWPEGQVSCPEEESEVQVKVIILKRKKSITSQIAQFKRMLAHQWEQNMP